jgi:hypothetical protein
MKKHFYSISPLLLSFLFIFTVPVKSFAQAPPILWQRCYGGDSTDAINCIKQTFDGGYIATGITESVNGDLAGNGGITGLWVLKLDPFGNIQWEKTYSNMPYVGSYIEQTTDSGYILTGAKTVKLYNDGSIAWIDSLGGNTVHQTSDGGYIVCHYSSPVLTKLNADGSMAWQMYNMSSVGDNLILNDVCQSYLGGYIITGAIYDVFYSPFIAKTDDMGNLLIPVEDGYANGEGLSLCKSNVNDIGIVSYSDTRIAATNTNGALVCGGNPNPVDDDIAVVAYDSLGNFLWNKNMGGSSDDAGNSVFQAANNNYVVAGYTYSNDGDVSGNHGGEDGWVVEFGTNTGIPGTTNKQPEIQVYPIPATDVIHIGLPAGYENATLKLLDVSGDAVQLTGTNTGLARVLYLRNLAAGEYLLQVVDNGSYSTKKIIHY